MPNKYKTMTPNKDKSNSESHEIFQNFLSFTGYLVIILTLGGISFNRSYSNQFAGLFINVNDLTEYSVTFTEEVILSDYYTIVFSLLIFFILGFSYFVLPYRFTNLKAHSILCFLLSLLMLLSIILGGFFGEEKAFMDQSSDSLLPSIKNIYFSTLDECKDAQGVYKNDIDNPVLLYTTQQARYIIETRAISKEDFKKKLTPTFYVSNKCIITMEVEVTNK